MSVRFLRWSCLLLVVAWRSGGVTLRAAEAPSVVPDAVGGGEYVFRQDVPELTEEQRREIQAAIDANIRMLEREGRLPPRTELLTPLGWPLRAAAGLTDPGY